VNVNLLIDAIVRQTTVLIAQLATAAGSRAMLANTANQVFTALVHELKEQGLGNKVIADMFGLSLRTYHNRMARLAESSTDRGRSLWEALLGFVEDRGPGLREEVLGRFRNDDETLVRGVLKDLVDSGMVYQAGRGDYTTYRAATRDSVGQGASRDDERVASFVWVAIHRYGPLTRGDLAERVPAGDDALDTAVTRLVREGRVSATEHDGKVHYASDECVIAVGDPVGWEAAVFDHYQAMVTAICTKVRLGRTRAAHGESIGGSTYGYDVWDGHPCRDEVLGFLDSTRKRAVQLRKDVEAYNANHPIPEDALHVIAYVGQTVLGAEEGADE